ncbi:MAG: hypothetical protein IT168_13860 [Bryobacterales bacterium]|nr:hypothetical protein [Bryobacterales bacterium]
MNCPFLRETRVRYCRRASQRKLIPHLAEAANEERCSTHDFVQCSLYRGQTECAAEAPPCPLLHESLVQFCAASSVTRFVPYSEAAISQCGSGSFRYCDLYLELTHAGAQALCEGVPIEPDLLYTRNHWWVDLPADGPCHVGIDAFLARLLGEASRIDYATKTGWVQPIASVTAGGADWQVTFPERVHLNRCNLYLRSNPARLAAEPYTQGWLFEGTLLADAAARLRRDCLTGDAARAWMERETRKVNEHVQQLSGAAADGGLFAQGLFSVLGREDALALFQEFGSPALPDKAAG